MTCTCAIIVELLSFSATLVEAARRWRIFVICSSFHLFPQLPISIESHFNLVNLQTKHTRLKHRRQVSVMTPTDSHKIPHLPTNRIHCFRMLSQILSWLEKTMIRLKTGTLLKIPDKVGPSFCFATLADEMHWHRHGLQRHRPEGCKKRIRMVLIST